jgi:predicted PurR-regulated permease PerM
MKETKTFKIEISPKTILVIGLMIFGIWIISKSMNVLFLVFAAYAVSALLAPIVDYLKSKKIPTNVSVVIIYLLFFSSLITLVLLLYQPIIHQFENFTTTLPDLVIRGIEAFIEQFPALGEQFDWDAIFNNMKDSFWQSSGLSNFLTNLPKHVISIIGSFFTILISFFSIIILSIYFIQGKEESKDKLTKLLPKKHQKRIRELIDNIELQLGAWLRGQILLMIIIGVLSWLGLQIVGIDFSLPLGLIGGILEIVPSFGPTFTWILALIVTIGSDAPPWKIIFVAVWFILIQQLENYLIVPKLMHKVVGLSPILTIIALLIASQLFGVAGTILAVPLVAIAQITARYYITNRE